MLNNVVGILFFKDYNTFELQLSGLKVDPMIMGSNLHNIFWGSISFLNLSEDNFFSFEIWVA